MSNVLFELEAGSDWIFYKISASAEFGSNSGQWLPNLNQSFFKFLSRSYNQELINYLANNTCKTMTFPSAASLAKVTNTQN